MVTTVSPLTQYFSCIGNVDGERAIYVYKPNTELKLMLTLAKKPTTPNDYFELAQFMLKGSPQFAEVDNAQRLKLHFVQNLMLDAALEGHARAKQHLEYREHRFWDAEKRNAYSVYYPMQLKSAYQLTKFRTNLAMYHVQLQALERVDLLKGLDPLPQLIHGEFFKLTTTASDLKKLLNSLERKLREVQSIERKQVTSIAYANATKHTNYLQDQSFTRQIGKTSHLTLLVDEENPALALPQLSH